MPSLQAATKNRANIVSPCVHAKISQLAKPTDFVRPMTGDVDVKNMYPTILAQQYSTKQNPERMAILKY